MFNLSKKKENNDLMKMREKSRFYGFEKTIDL